MPTLDLQDGLETTSGTSGTPLAGALPMLDRRYLVGCIAGLLIGGALAVPAAYGVLRASAPVARVPADDSAALNALVSGGIDALARKDAEHALSLFRIAAQAFPRNAKVHNNICVALNDLGRYEEAVSACQTALALEPKLGLAVNNLAWARSQLAKTELAKTAPR